MAEIALIDDNRNFLVSVSMSLEAEGFEVNTYSDGQSALNAFSNRMPDLAVLDLKMPRMGGMEVLEWLRRKSALPVIILSSKEDEVDEILSLRKGADIYLHKSCSQRLLLERIRALLRRQEALTAGDFGIVPSAFSCGPLDMDPQRHEVMWKGKRVSLTVSEFLLLQALARQPGVLMSRDQLMDVVVGNDEVYVGDRSIDGHIKRLRHKMRDAEKDFSAIETIYGIGYRYNRKVEAET